MNDFELDYDVQEVRLSEQHTFRVTTVGNEALPLEMLLDLESRREEISGQRLWEGSLLLCSDLLQRAGTGRLSLKGKAVLELGAGTGVVSMLAHRLGAAPVVVTDGDDKCAMMATTNLRENGISAKEALVTVLRWGEGGSTRAFCDTYSSWASRGRKSTQQGAGATIVSDSTAVKDQSTVDRSKISPVEPATNVGAHEGDSSGCSEEVDVRCGSGGGTRTPLKAFDFILAGDVLYKEELLAPFLQTLEDMLAPEGTLLLCHVPRAGVTCDKVERAFTKAGFDVRVLEKLTKDGAVHETSADVGGVELCADDTRRARLYDISRTTVL